MSFAADHNRPHHSEQQVAIEFSEKNGVLVATSGATEVLFAGGAEFVGIIGLCVFVNGDRGVLVGSTSAGVFVDTGRGVLGGRIGVLVGGGRDVLVAIATEVLVEKGIGVFVRVGMIVGVFV